MASILPLSGCILFAALRQTVCKILVLQRGLIARGLMLKSYIAPGARYFFYAFRLQSVTCNPCWPVNIHFTVMLVQQFLYCCNDGLKYTVKYGSSVQIVYFLLIKLFFVEEIWLFTMSTRQQNIILADTRGADLVKEKRLFIGKLHFAIEFFLGLSK